MTAPKPLPAGRARKVASKNLGIALQTAYRRLIEANGSDDVQVAAIELGQVFNTNIEFIIWVLKEFGGTNQMPPERKFAVNIPAPLATKDKPALSIVPPANVNEENKLPVLGELLTGETPKKRSRKKPEEVIPKGCTCPPLEAGIIGRDKHMTSCPEYRV
jgi:hypothetical protein